MIGTPKRSGEGWFARARRSYARHVAASTGSLNRADIVATFGVSTAQASADIAALLESLPGSLSYDTVAKKYHWTGAKSSSSAPPAPIGAWRAKSPVPSGRY